jgi:hypothetical protein
MFRTIALGVNPACLGIAIDGLVFWDNGDVDELKDGSVIIRSMSFSLLDVLPEERVRDFCSLEDEKSEASGWWCYPHWVCAGVPQPEDLNKECWV